MKNGNEHKDGHVEDGDDDKMMMKMEMTMHMRR